MYSICDYTEQADNIVAFSRIVYERGLVSAAGGNLSARCGDNLLITGTNVPLRSVSRENLVLCDMKRNVLESPAKIKPSKELGFHIGVYASRPEINYVIHAHPNFAIIASLSMRTLPLYTESAKMKLKNVPIIPVGTPGSDDLMGKVVKAVSNYPHDITAFLMEAHGVLVAGETMEACFEQTELLEDSAKIAVFQKLMGSCVD